MIYNSDAGPSLQQKSTLVEIPLYQSLDCNAEIDGLSDLYKESFLLASFTFKF